MINDFQTTFKTLNVIDQSFEFQHVPFRLVVFVHRTFFRSNLFDYLSSFIVCIHFYFRCKPTRVHDFGACPIYFERWSNENISPIF